MKGIQAQISSQEGDVAALSSQLYEGLQEIGLYLDNATVPDAIALKNRVYTDKEVQTLNAITDRIDSYTAGEADEDGGNYLKIVGPQDRFTVLFLSVPVTISAPPKSTVFFECEMGGHFVSNGLSVKEVQADETGIVHVQWISDGDSAGQSFLSVISPQAPNSLCIPIRVVDLKLSLPFNFVP